MDTFGNYTYIFYMCGSLSVTGGLFLFVMNMYNYRVLEKERTKMDVDKNHKTKDGPGLVEASEVQHAEMQLVPEAAMEQTKPEAADGNEAEGDPRPQNTETPSNL